MKATALRAQWGWQRRPRLAEALGVSRYEWVDILAAAADSCLTVRDYCRLVLLCAAGRRGSLNSLRRTIRAQEEVMREASMVAVNSMATAKAERARQLKAKRAEVR